MKDTFFKIRKLMRIHLIVGAGFLTSACNEQGPASTRDTNTQDLSSEPGTDPNSTNLLGTQIGNPLDPYQLALLLNGERPEPSVQISAEDEFTCESMIDVSDFEAELQSGSLRLTYFILAKDLDSLRKRNYLNTVTGQGLFSGFGLGSNLEIKCQAVIYTPSFQSVFSHTSEPAYCYNCGSDQ